MFTASTTLSVSKEKKRETSCSSKSKRTRNAPTKEATIIAAYITNNANVLLEKKSGISFKKCLNILLISTFIYLISIAITLPDTHI